jgi:hypothetical protein
MKVSSVLRKSSERRMSVKEPEGAATVESANAGRASASLTRCQSVEVIPIAWCQLLRALVVVDVEGPP